MGQWIVVMTWLPSFVVAQFVLPIVVAWVATRMSGWNATLGVMLPLSFVGVLAALGVAPCERKL